MGNLNFDASDVPTETGFEPLPAGEYEALIEESEVKPTRTGTGHYLQLVWQVVDGDYKGRKLWHRININNANPKAEEIGKRELSAICHAVGVLKVDDSTELHDRPCLLDVVVRPAEGQYGPGNEVKRVRSLNTSAPVPPTLVASQAPAPAAPAASAPPWQR